ncbi:hypothetical protein TWF751_003914 [Orbilia oligospora]|nr:hypothetical protein TWF751_003914 [Orbilia oligospora]
MKPSKQDYTVGWICALPIEKAAAIAVLDEKHDELPAAPSEGDSNIYTVGRIGKHNVVIVCLPAGNYGTNSAATVATNFRRSFPSLRFGLMVGIGSEVPNDENDVRLGDIVVSQPLHDTSGVVQYDLGKRVGEDTFHRTGWLNASPTILLNASASLQAEKSLYQLVREEREHDNPVVHYGIIASGNQVIKDAIARDKIGKEAKAICFEMEAAGLMNHFPCLVIRGVCDYSDSHKNKAWQPYAAITAAAYTKELLNHVPALDGPGSARTENVVDVYKSIQALASVSRDPEVEKTGIERRKDKLINGSYQWVKDHQTFKDWLTKGFQILHLIGGAGKGKTMIMIGLINEFESGTKIPRENDNELQETLFLPGPIYFSYFLCQGTNDHLNSAHSVLKGLLLLLLRKHQNLAIHLQKRYDLIGADSFANMIDINLLQLFLFEILDDPSDPSVVFCIDALDECFVDQIEQLDIKTRGRCFDILATAAIVYHPLRLEEMGTIAIMTDYLLDIRRLVKLCGCFLSIENDSVYFIHQSAKDYLVSDHSRLFTTAGTTSRHKNVFNSCIQTLSNPVVLKKDIAGLGWPGTLYTEITTKQRSCVTKIAYACCYWARHLETFWENDNLQEILLDAKEFLRHNFSRIEQSPLQIYSSAFILSPPRSLTTTMNAHRLSEWLDPESRGSSDETWSSCQTLILQGLQDCRVIPATYSPDGKLIAAFCDQIHSAAIKTWNSANGLCLHVLPIPRSIYVNDSWLSFSSDNTLVSFYYPMDSKVRVWDTNTGLAIKDKYQQ